MQVPWIDTMGFIVIIWGTPLRVWSARMTGCRGPSAFTLGTPQHTAQLI
jgi:hypothetical protein